MLMEPCDPGRRLMFALGESQTHVAITFDVAALLQTRPPTGKNCGPAAGLLLSIPTTFHVMGVPVNVAVATAGANRPITKAPKKAILSALMAFASLVAD